MTQTDKVLSRKDGNVGTLTFNNPERHNAMSLEMWEACKQAMDGFAADPEIRVVILTGAGNKAFIAGADISKFGDERASEEGVRRYNGAVEAAYVSVHEFPKPTIAMIRGYCIGGGVGLALCCDMRICTEGSKFAVPAAKLSLGYRYSGLKKLVDVVGPSFAKEIFFSAKRFSAEDARVMGLVNRVVANEALEATVVDYASTIAGNAPLTVASVKRIVAEALKDRGAADEAACDALVKACFASEDYIEGRRAFMEKRPPRFLGR